jgi:hypothetical protein
MPGPRASASPIAIEVAFLVRYCERHWQHRGRELCLEAVDTEMPDVRPGGEDRIAFASAIVSG